MIQVTQNGYGKQMLETGDIARVAEAE